MSRLAKRPRANHAEAAAQMRANPDTWTFVGLYNSPASADSAVRYVTTGRRAPMYNPPGSFEARKRLVDDGTEVIARYVGNQSVADGGSR